jgi:hypothetical protein
MRKVNRPFAGQRIQVLETDVEDAHGLFLRPVA